MRVGVDLDGVVANFVEGFRSKLSAYGYPVTTLPDPDRWEMWECWGMTREQWTALFDKAAAEGLFHQLHAYDGAVEGLKQLKDSGHSIHVITHRAQPHAQTSTVGWLGALGIPYDSLTFTKDKSSYPVDVMIEDNVENARAVEAAGVPCVLMTRKWNEAEDWHLRAGSWQEFVELVDLLELPPHAGWCNKEQDGGNSYAFECDCSRRSVDVAGLNAVREQTVKLAKKVGEVRETSPTGGQKGQKPEQYSMIPVDALAEVARVYAFGAQKYDRDNWRKGYPWHNSYDALLRHCNAFWGGETFDPESGYHHLAHAVFHCFTLITYGADLELYGQFDDRQRPNPS